MDTMALTFNVPEELRAEQYGCEKTFRGGGTAKKN